MSYRIEIKPPDIEPYRKGNAGVEFVHVLDSGKPGPNVMVQALTHGNELCGAYALDFLFREHARPNRGKLVLAFANVAAFARFDFDDPDRSRYIDEDYNRVWADDVILGKRDSAELRRARELRPFVDAADYLLDLHSMHEPCRPIMVCGMLDKGAKLARKIGVPADVLIECGQHWEKSSVDVAIDTTLRFLGATGIVAAAWVNARLKLQPPKEQRIVRVTEPV